MLFPLWAPPEVWRLALPSPLTSALAAAVLTEEGAAAEEEDDAAEALASDIMAAVVVETAARFLSEPSGELESASMHSDASSGSDPEPQPEEEEEEEEEGQTDELVEERLLGLSALPSTRTASQLLLPSPPQGEPVDQGDGSY